MLISLVAAFGCAEPPLVGGGLGYPGATRPGVATGPLATKPVAAATTGSGPPSTRTPTTGGIVLLAPSFGNTPFGSDGPLLVERVSADGGWLSLCQARNDSNGDGQVSVSVGPRGEARGDKLQRFLRTPTEESAVDGVLGSDPSGRFALLVTGGALVLRDTRGPHTVDLSALGAETRLSAESFAELRTVAFDASSEHLLYVRAGDQDKRVVVRSLDDGSERELDPGPGAIWRARFDPGGVFIVLKMMTEDSNKNGRADFPAPLLEEPRACSAGPGRFHTFAFRGDHPQTVLLPVIGGAPIQEPELLMPVQDALLLRDATGALSLQRAGKKRVIEPAACKGRVVHADAQRELFIVGCVQKKKTGKVSLELVTRTERKALNIELASTELDHEVSDSPRLVPLYPGLDSALFDAEKRDLIPLSTGDVVITTWGARALVRRGKALIVYDAEARSERALAGSLDRYPDVLLAPPFAFVSPLLVDLDRATTVLVDQPRPLALSSSGQLLFAATPADGATLARGPLRWVSFGAQSQ